MSQCTELLSHVFIQWSKAAERILTWPCRWKHALKISKDSEEDTVRWTVLQNFSPVNLSIDGKLEGFKIETGHHWSVRMCQLRHPGRRQSQECVQDGRSSMS